MSGGLHVGELAVLLLLVSLVLIFRQLLVRRAQDPFGVFLLTFAVFYVFRAVLIACGLDTPIPTYLFATSNVEAIFTRTVLGLCVYLGAFMVAAFLVTRRPASSPSPLFSSNPTNVTRVVCVSLALTAVALLIQGYLLARFGSFGGILYASKVEKALAGTHYLMLPSEVAALGSTAAYLEVRHRPGPKTGLRFLMLGCALLDSVLVFAWGARGFLVIIVAMLLLVSGPLHRPRKPHLGISGVARIALATLLVLSLAIFLRDTRDNLTRPGQTHSFAQQSIWRQASHGINGNSFDSSMLVFRDWPAKHRLRNGIDYWNGALGVVPRKIWPDKPKPYAVAFRQIYQPHTLNGWPVGAPTTWYMNFGWLGLIIGGLISGAVIGAVARRYAAAPWSGVNTALTFTIGVFVLRMGWGGQTPQEVVTTLIPVAIVLRFFAPKPRSRPEGPEDSRTAEDTRSGQRLVGVGQNGRLPLVATKGDHLS
jgi:oligosaccharide repeat unit polymerase